MHHSSKILNGRLAAIVTTLRYGETVVVADAGLPVPAGVPTLELALTPGVPTTMQVVELLQHELVLSEVRIASQMAHANTALRQELVDLFSATDLLREVDHVEGIENELTRAKLVIQTAEMTPYGNVVLVGGLAFFDMTMAQS